MPTRKARQRIPLCRAEVLQDITIALGRRSKGFSYSLFDFDCSVSQDDDGDSSYECLTIRGQLHDRSILSLHVWEDRTAQLQYSRKDSRLPQAYRWSFYPNLGGFTPEGIVAALKETFECSSSVYYRADYIKRIMENWEFDGEVTQTNPPPETTNSEQDVAF